MSRLTDFLWCVLFAFAAVIISIKLSPQKVEAVEVKPHYELTIPKVEPKSFNLELDLSKGTARVESDAEISNANVTVNHPAPQVINKPAKVKIKKVYETKTEVLSKVVMFKMPTPRLIHTTTPEYPTRVVK